MSSDEQDSNPEAELIETGARLESDGAGKVTEHHEAEVNLGRRWAKTLENLFLKLTKNNKDSE